MTRSTSIVVFCVAAFLAGCTGGSSIHAGGSGIISIDGDTSDWADIKPVMFDTSGDSTQVAGSDVIALWVLSDSEYVYIRLDLANGDPADNMQIGVSFGASADTYVGNSYVSIYTSPNTSGAYRRGESSGEYLGPMEYIISDGIIEIAVRRDVLAAPAVSYVKFWTQLLTESSQLDKPGGAVEYLF